MTSLLFIMAPYYKVLPQKVLLSLDREVLLGGEKKCFIQRPQRVCCNL